MPEYIKILGQVSGSPAGAIQQLSMFPDPNGEFSTTNVTYANPTQSPLFGLPTDNGGGINENCIIGWTTSQHAPNSANSTGRTNSFYTSTHSSNYRPLWKLSTNTTGLERPFLKSGQVYTMSFWTKAMDQNQGHWSSHHGHGGMHYSRGVNTYDLVPYTSSFTQHFYSQYGWNDDSSAHNNWKQWYGTFTGEGGFFDFQVQMRNHSYNEWTYLYFDNFTLLEGAVPKALLPTRPTDGASGNANALYTSPYTTRSEGWSNIAYRSPTIRKLTGSWQTLYTCPDSRTAVASTLVISNYGTAAATYRIAVQKYGETLASNHILAFDHPIIQTSSESMSIGLTLSAGDRVIVQSDTDKINFQLFGAEQTVG
jgi:hypothetical protein